MRSKRASSRYECKTGARRGDWAARVETPYNPDRLAPIGVLRLRARPTRKTSGSKILCGRCAWALCLGAVLDFITTSAPRTRVHWLVQSDQRLEEGADHVDYRMRLPSGVSASGDL